MKWKIYALQVQVAIKQMHNKFTPDSETDNSHLTVVAVGMSR